MKKSKIFAPVVAVAAALSLAACNAADTASRNISYESNNFKVMRRIVFVNSITDKYLLSIEGLCSITKDREDNQLEVICKTGDSEYKKHYLGISDNVTYFVEQMDGSNIDAFHYNVASRPEELLPDIDLQTSGDEN